MKNTVIPILSLGFAASISFADIQVMDQDTVEIANMMKHKCVQLCIEKAERESAAQLSISSITKEVLEDVTQFKISGVLLQGGDIAKGYLTLEVDGSIQPFLGWGYACKVVKK